MRTTILSGATCVLGAGFFLLGCAGDDTVVPPQDSGTPRDGSFDAMTFDAGLDAGQPDATATDAADAAHEAADAPSEASAADCIASSGASAFFTLNDATKCVVGVYTVAVPSVSSLTWGRHGGPLGFNGSALLRYTVPAGAMGALTATSTPLTVTGVPSGAFWGSQALDFPFFPSLSWTAVAYSGSGAGFPGEIIIVDGNGAVAKRYNVNGFFAETAVGIASSGGRLVYTGLSPLMSSAASTNAGGVYAADTCGTAATNPRLLPEGDTTCATSFKVSTWGDGYSGPVAADAAGNVVAFLTSASTGTQELRGFEHETIARGAPAIAGTTLASLPGYTGELAADGRAAYFQPNDSSTFMALDVLRVGYTVDSSAKTITGSGAPTTFLTMATAGTSVALIVDSQGRLWVGVTNPPVGDAGPTSSTFFVIRDKTP